MVISGLPHRSVQVLSFVQMSTGPSAVSPGGEDLPALEHAIATLEAQRAVLGDAVVDTALVPLQARLAALVDKAQGEQRRLVTVVFADLVGFTELSSWLDAEDTRGIVDAYFTRWLRVIEEHGGVVEKFIGDAVMAVFGLRQSWEDDAQRAVRSALAMLTELRTLNTRFQQEYGVELRMRVGVDTGDVVVSTLGDRGGAEFVVVGQSVNRASRLQSAAPPDGILISADTHRQIRGRFSMQRREGLVLKGIEEPVDAYLVTSERPHGFQLDRSRGVEGVETTTVGREIELRYLQERLWDVVEEARWRVVTVVGDAGVGKSRLLLDFDSWLAERSEPVWWFRGRASHTGQHHANALLRDVVAGRFGINESDSAGQVRAKLEEGFADAYRSSAEPGGPAEAEAARRAARLVGSWLSFDLGAPDDLDVPPDPQALRDGATQALAEYLSRLSRRAPVVVLLEDLHWADDGSLRWLDAAAEALTDSRVLVVATARPSLVEERPHWGEGLEHHLRLALSPLSRRESRLLLEQLLHRVQDAPAALLDLVIGSAEGNPFYIEELVTWMVDAGVIVKGPDSWRVENDLVGSAVVPSTLRGVLQARLDSLSAAERGLLQRASVVGRVFWDDAVGRLADDLADRATPRAIDHASAAGQVDQDAARLSATLDDLRRRELVFEREVSSFDSAREFLFKHALLRDVAYDGVLRAHRQRYHARAGAWLAEVSARSGRQDEYAALVAEHFDRAGDPAAGPWYFRAGRQALSVYALTEAGQLLGRALELVSDDVALRFDILVAREAMLDRVGDRDGQLLDLTELEELADRLEDDPHRTIQVQLARSRWSFATSDYDEAELWAEQAAGTAEAAALDAELAEARLWLGKALTWHDEAEAAREALGRALEEADAAGRPLLAAEALRYLSILANNEGDYPVALDYVEQARAAFAAVGDLEGEATALSQGASTLYNLDRYDEARAALEQTLPLFRRSGHRYRETIVLGNLATIALGQNELVDARRWAGEAVQHTRQLVDREATSTNLILQGMVAAAIGDWADAERLYQESLETARDVESHTHEVEALTRLALLEIARGDPGRAVGFARAAEEASRSALSPLERGHAQLVRGYAELGTGARSAAERLFEAAEESFSSLDVRAMTRESRVARASVALARGDLSHAVRLVEPALECLDRAGLEGVGRPALLLRTCWQVLDAAGDPRAGEVLRAGQRSLREIAGRVGDPDLTSRFLATPDNAALLAERGT
jgi:class 3 adenylate cyclase/predicted ATPase